MGIISKISFSENVAIVSFEKSAAHIEFLANMFSLVAAANINIDMISQTAPKGEFITISFTVAEDDVTAILEIVAGMQLENKLLMPLISSGNVKISLYGEDMPNHSGVAAGVFSKLNAQGIDTMLITTSDVDISLVIADENADLAYSTLKESYLD